MFKKGHKHSEETKRKIGLANKVALKGKKHTEEAKKKMKKSAKLRIEKYPHTKPKPFKRGKEHYNWRGGISFEPYGLEFNEDLKEVIRNRDRRKCFICEKTELDNKEKLTVHHIDYNKQNNNPDNLISLCRKCHTKTNHNRNYWINYFNNFK